MSQPWTTKLRFISISSVHLADGKLHWPSRMMTLLNYVLSLLGEWGNSTGSWELSFELKGILGRRHDGCILSFLCTFFHFPGPLLSLSLAPSKLYLFRDPRSHTEAVCWQAWFHHAVAFGSVCMTENRSVVVAIQKIRDTRYTIRDYYNADMASHSNSTATFFENISYYTAASSSPRNLNPVCALDDFSSRWWQVTVFMSESLNQ